MLRFIVPESVRTRFEWMRHGVRRKWGKRVFKGFPLKKKTVLRGAVRGGRCTATGSKKIDQ